MKTFTLALLFWIVTTGSTYKADNFTNKFIFKARIGASEFAADENQLSVMLLNQAGSLDGRRPARKIISIIQNGPSYMTTDGRLFNESIQFEINFEELMQPELSVYTVALQHNSTVYSLIKHPGDLKITAFEWEADHKHFHISLDFNCTMRSWGYPNDNQPDVQLQGKMIDITLATPARQIVASNKP